MALEFWQELHWIADGFGLYEHLDNISSPNSRTLYTFPFKRHPTFQKFALHQLTSMKHLS